jgi:putative oxidoreductase
MESTIKDGLMTRQAMISKQLLKISGGLSFMVGIFQALISFSPKWSWYFGAPEGLVSRPPLLYAAGMAAALVFIVFGLYAFSGAGHIRPLPFLRLGLLGIGSVYTFRGLFAIPLMMSMAGFLRPSGEIPPQGLSASLISLFIGVLYLTATVLAWRELPSQGKR